MKIGRVAVLGVAVGAGLIAALIALNLAKAPPPAPVVVEGAPAPAPVSTQVLVAANNIAIGQKLTSGSMQWQDWPTTGVAGTYISKTGTGESQLDPLVGSIARATIYAGEPISEAKLIHSDRGFMSAILPQGMRAVATKISADTGAGGFILPNDRVDVVMTRKASDTAVAGGNEFLTETILNNVRVLAIDQTIENTDANTAGAAADGAAESGQTVIGQTATLELTPLQVQILTVAQQMSDEPLTLALRSVADSNVGPADAAADAIHLIGGTKRNGAITIVKNGVARDVSGIR
jgi:pilus assembly protein CpaB